MMKVCGDWLSTTDGKKNCRARLSTVTLFFLLMNFSFSSLCFGYQHGHFDCLSHVPAATRAGENDGAFRRCHNPGLASNA